MKKDTVLKYEGNLLWDGRQEVTATTYSASERETLFRTRSGRWVLRIVLNYFDRCAETKYIEIKNLKTVAKWLVINGYEPHPDVEQEYLELCLHRSKTLKASQRIALTDGTGRWFDLALAIRLNPVFSSDFIVIKEIQDYAPSAYLAETYLLIDSDLTILHLRAINENAASHRWFLDE